MYIRPGNWLFQMVELWKCYRLGRVACRAEVESAVESALCVGQGEVHLFLCVSIVSADSCGAILSRKAAGRLGMTKHCRVSLYRSPHLFIPRKLNTPLVLFFDLGAWFFEEMFRFLYCGARKAFFGHFGHIQCQAHVGLFQKYPTSLPCHSCRHVENLQDISWCF